MTVTGGMLTGDGILRATAPLGGQATLSWSAATMSGTCNVIIDPNATMYLQGAFTDSGFTIINNSLLEWDAGNVTLNNGAVINNQAGATFQTFANATMNSTAGAATFNNFGRFVKFQGFGQQAGATTIQVTFDSLTAQGQQPSTVDAEFGMIGVRAGGSLQANVIAAGGCQVEFGGPVQTITALDGTTFNGAGTVRIDFSGTLTLANNATVTNYGNFEIGNPFLLRPLNTGQLSGYGFFANYGTFTWSVGDVTKVTAVKNYGQMNLANSDANRPITLNSSVIANYAAGIMTWTSYDIQMTSQIDPQQPSEIDNFGRFDILNDQRFRDDTEHPSLGITNESGALIQKSAGNGTTTIDTVFTNLGALAVLGRNMTFTAGIDQGGGTTSIANGTLTASFFRSSGAGSGIDLGNAGNA
jgi:hypothetical protein